MLFSPSLLLQIGKALTLIMIPHQHPVHSTRSIQQGQQLLHSLRNNKAYPTLLTYCLANPPCLQPHSTPTQIRIFLLLQLQKYPYEIEPECAWWSLLEMYYNCNEKLEEMIIRIITKRITAKSHPYKEFIHCVLRGDKWGISAITKCIKLIKNVLIMVQEIQGIDDQQFRGHVQFISWSLVQLLGYSKEQFSGFIDCLVILIMQTVEMDPGQAVNTLSPLLSTLHSYNTTPPISNILMYLSSILHSVNIFPFFAQLPISSLISDCLPQMLSYKSNESLVRPITLLNSLLRKLGSTGEQIVLSCRNEIVLTYWKYISAKFEKYGWLACEWDDFEEQAERERRLDNYFLLAVCLQTSHEGYCLPSPLSLPILESFCLKKTSNLHLEIIMQYIHSYMHHSLPQDCKILIFGCFNYIYRFGCQSLNYNIVQVCQQLISFRTVIPEMKSICDRILFKCTDVLIACQNMQELWNFSKFWISSLTANYMDIDANSFMPILQILDVLDDWYLVDRDEICYSNLIGNVVELICDQLKQTAFKNSVPGYKNMKFGNGTGNDRYEHGIFQIYYKLSDIAMKHILALYKHTPKQLLHQQRSKLTRVLGQLTTLSFQNQLYNPTTAFIYVQYLQHSDDKSKTEQFVGSMMNDSFWEGFSLELVLFFGCVLIGLVKMNGFEIEIGQIYGQLGNIASKIAEPNGESILGLKNELTGFMGNIGIRESQVQEWGAEKDRKACHNFDRATSIFP